MYQALELPQAGNPASQNLILQPVDEHDLSLLEAQAEALRDLMGNQDFCIAALPITDWNQELTPWEAGPVFGKTPFGAGAPKTLRHILEDLLPALGENKGRSIYLCGYSLAGLFALWSAYQTPRFAGVICASPSVWYPDWISYAKAHTIQTPRVYLSLGDKEERARNPLMAQVGSCIRTQHQLLKEGNIDTILEYNPGNHFVDSEKRLAKGIAWCLKK